MADTRRLEPQIDGQLGITLPTSTGAELNAPNDAEWHPSAGVQPILQSICNRSGFWKWLFSDGRLSKVRTTSDQQVTKIRSVHHDWSRV